MQYGVKAAAEGPAVAAQGAEDAGDAGRTERNGAQTDAILRSPRGGGQPLPPALKGKMDRAFGSDFSDVRVHEGDEAGALGAHAFAQGTDIHMAPGQYAPESEKGQALIGHELAHVVQQSQGRVATPQAKGGGVNQDAGLEHEADQMGDRAARGEVVGAFGAKPTASRGPVQLKLITKTEKSGGGQVDTNTKAFATYVNYLAENDLAALEALRVEVAGEPKALALVGAAQDRALGIDDKPAPRKKKQQGGAKAAAQKPAPKVQLSKSKVKDNVVDTRATCDDEALRNVLFSKPERDRYDAYEEEYRRLLALVDTRAPNLEAIQAAIDTNLTPHKATLLALKVRFDAVNNSPVKKAFALRYRAAAVAHLDGAAPAALKTLDETIAGIPMDLPSIVTPPQLAGVNQSIAATVGFTSFLRTYKQHAISAAVRANGAAISLAAERERIQQAEGITHVASGAVGPGSRDFARGAEGAFDAFNADFEKTSLTSDQKAAVLGKPVDQMNGGERDRYRTLTPQTGGLSQLEQERMTQQVAAERNKLNQKVFGTMELKLEDGTVVNRELQLFISGGEGSSDYRYDGEKQTGQGTGALADKTYAVTGQKKEDYPEGHGHIGHHEHQRDNDAEVKVMETTLRLLSQQQEAGKDIANATLKVFVSRYTCPSCSDMLYKAKTQNATLRNLRTIEVIYQGDRMD